MIAAASGDIEKYAKELSNEGTIEGKYGVVGIRCKDSDAVGDVKDKLLHKEYEHRRKINGAWISGSTGINDSTNVVFIGIKGTD